MKTNKTFEIEIQRSNVTPAQFLAYVRSRVDAKGGKDLRGDLGLAYFKAGNDLNFDHEHDGMREKSISKPYEMQTYIRYESGATYNEICEFEFDTEKTGHGYYYLVNVEEVEEEEPTAEATESTEAVEVREIIDPDGIHKRTIAKNGTAYIVIFFEMMGGRWVPLSDPEQWSPELLQELVEA